MGQRWAGKIFVSLTSDIDPLHFIRANGFMCKTNVCLVEGTSGQGPSVLTVMKCISAVVLSIYVIPESRQLMDVIPLPSFSLCLAL